MRFAIHAPNFGSPTNLFELALAAEAHGWDGFFLWDHVGSPAETPIEVLDPWVMLGAIASRTERIRLGTAVTPLARRRPHVVAREAATLDVVSGGRAVLGVGLGNPPQTEFAAFGEPADAQHRAPLLDEGLGLIAALWTGERVDHEGPAYTARGVVFLPQPVQQPRIPIWAACALPHRAPLRRAARWDGVLLSGPVDGELAPPTPEEVHEAAEELAALAGEPRDVAVVAAGPPPDPAAYREAGATWWLATGWPAQLADMASGAPPRL